MGGLGLKEVLLIVFIIVILFGAKRIPEVARGMGRGVREFKEGMQGEPKETPKSGDSSESKPQ